MRPLSRLTLLLLLLIFASGCRRQADPFAVTVRENAAAAQRILADVRALADDRMRGRLTATPDFDRAAAFVASRLAAIGLKPAGDHSGWYQAVPLLRATRDRQGATFDIRRDGRTTRLQLREQFLPALDFEHAQAAIQAPALFVGHGIAAPAQHYDDFAGLDLHGRIAVLFSGAPMRLDAGWRALHASREDKLRTLAQRGAVGAVFVDTAADEAQLPWSRINERWNQPGLALRAADGGPLDRNPGLQVVATLSASAADALFAGSGHGAAELFRAAQDGTLHGFALPGTLSLTASTRIERIEGRNVVARLAGSDAALAREHVVLSAHLDHLGVVAPVVGDDIANGALDNALGVAIALEAAHVLHAGARPKRSLLLLASSGEEQGLLGARWFTLHPPGVLVADLNIDMPLLLAPTRDVVAIGAEHSSLQGLLQQAAGDIGVEISPDPFPEEDAFVRSDQYAFVRAGIPALYLDAGVTASSTGDPRLAQRDFMRRCYHQPCDDGHQSIQYGDAGRMARLLAHLATLAADAPQPPRWHAGDSFASAVPAP